MPPWVAGIFTSLFRGVLSMFDTDHKESLRQRVRAIEAEKQSIIKAAEDEKKIADALQGGEQILTADDWNKAISQ